MRSDGKKTWLMLALMCFCGCLGVPAAAQSLSVADPDRAAMPAFDLITDVFVGKGTGGPYILSWKNIEADTETVIVSGRKLVRGQDYAIDPAAGAVAFNTPLAKDSIARVTYKRMPGKAVQNGGGLSLPLSLRLLDRDTGSLDVTGLYRGGDPKSSGSGLAVVGLSGGMKLRSGSDLSSAFLISQSSAGSGGRKPGLSDRSAVRLVTTAGAGSASLNASFIRSGEHFAGAQEYGFQGAKQLVDLTGGFGRQSGPVFASFSLKEQEELGGAKKGEGQMSSEAKVVVDLENAPKLTFSRAANEKSLPGGKSAGVTTDTLTLEQGFGQKTSAAAGMQRSRILGDARDDVKTTSFVVQSSAINKVQLQGNLTWKDSEKTGGEAGAGVAMKVTPNKRMSIDAGFSNVRSEKKGEITTTAVKVAASPADRVQMGLDFSRLDNDAGGVTKTGLSVAANPLDRLSLGVNLSRTDPDKGPTVTSTAVRIAAKPVDRVSMGVDVSKVDNEKGAVTSTAVKVAANPSDRVDVAADASWLDAAGGGQSTSGVRVTAQPTDRTRVEASYAGKQVDKGPGEQQKGVRVESQPASFMKLSAAMANKEVGSQVSVTREAGFELAPSGRLRLASSYRQSGPEQASTTVRDYSGTLKPADFLEVSGSYKNRNNAGAAPLDSKSLNVVLGPSGAPLRFTGQYTYNPEDKKGNVQRFSSTTAGIEMRVGIVGLTGAYTEKDEYLAGRMSQETEVAMNMPVFGHGRLKTGCKMSSLVAASPQSTVTYSIGYTHDLGSLFNLALTGELVHSEMGAAGPEQEYKATAKIGIRF